MSHPDIGRAGRPFAWPIERGKVAEFSRAIGSTDPGYQEPDAVAPPTFPITSVLWRPDDATPELSEPLDPSRVLHGGQEFEYLRPLRVGDTLTAQITVQDVFEKQGGKGGRMRFVVFETTFRDDSAKAVAWSRSTLLETEAAVSPRV